MKNRITKEPHIENLLSENKYPEAIEKLFEIQKNEWKTLAGNYTDLAKVKTKDFYFDGFKIKAQFNPQRLASTTAKTDLNSIKNRKCFLCEENLPDEQTGFLINNSMMMLINPFPIFPIHLTIAHRKHIPQEILPHFELLIDCSKKIGRNYSLLYNGPNCGASAPDHLHFQAGKKFFLPFDDDFHQLKNEYGETLLNNDLVEISAVDDGLRKFISIETNDNIILSQTFSLLYNIVELICNTNDEPKMNIICNYEEDFGWRLVVFLRSKHRPAVYFSSGDDKLLFSPAVVDVGGLCILPDENDFNKIDKNILTEIFKEVFIDDNHFLKIKNEYSNRLIYDSFND